MEIDKIYCGDCLALLPKIESGSIDHAITSPPYNRLRNDKYAEYDDRIKDYHSFLCSFTNELLRVCRSNVMINIQKTMYNKVDVMKYIGDFSDKINEIFVWEKTNPMPAAGTAITNAYEFVFFMSKSGKVESNSTYTKNVIQTQVFNSGPKDHKAVMNPEVAKFFIGNFTKEGDSIIDPFMGYGTTAIVAKSMGRHYLGFEIVKKYCNEANERIKDPSASCRFDTNYTQGRLF